MIFIPLFSIEYYLITDGSLPYKGFLLIKAYLFLTFAFLVYLTRIDAINYLAVSLTLLSVSIITLTIYIFIYPAWYMPIYYFGEQFGIFSIDKGRSYGGNQSFFQMYFVTSSMLVIAIAYYYSKWRNASRYRILYLSLFLLNVSAMMLAGTRNNLIISIALPVALIILYSRKKILTSSLVACIMLCVIAFIYNDIIAFFDPAEESNATKLTMAKDYMMIFNNEMTLLFGRGLGSYEHWTGRGYNFLTELTYFEVARNYGIIFGSVMLVLIIYPIVYAFILHPEYQEKNIILAYSAYLVMSTSNPLFFSSMGILILAIIIARIFLYDNDIKEHKPNISNLRNNYQFN